KTADYGYDGKGQVRIDSSGEGEPPAEPARQEPRPPKLEEVWSAMGRPVGVLEGFVRFEKEIYVICARTTSGETRCFDVAENHHERHILDVTTVPAVISPKLAREAIELATAITNALKVVGLLAVEMFVVGERVIVNELAPRPHNSGHFSFDACVTSQFEQQLRAVCGLPLGDPMLLRPAAMANLLGDLWQGGDPNWQAALHTDERIKLHLYGKQDP